MEGGISRTQRVTVGDDYKKLANQAEKKSRGMIILIKLSGCLSVSE